MVDISADADVSEFEMFMLLIPTGRPGTWGRLCRRGRSLVFVATGPVVDVIGGEVPEDADDLGALWGCN